MDSLTTGSLDVTSRILGIPSEVCTYHGYLDFDESESEMLDWSIQEGSIPDVKREWGNKGIDLDDVVDYDDVIYQEDKNGKDYYQRFKEELVCNIKGSILASGINERLKEFGAEIIDASFWSPDEYNFQGDSIDIKLELTKDMRKELLPEIQDYIDNVMLHSCDGYSSWEETNPERIDLDSGAYVYALLKKIDALDDLKSAILDETENAYEIFSNNFMESVYQYLDTRPVYQKMEAERKKKEFNEKKQLVLPKL